MLWSVAGGPDSLRQLNATAGVVENAVNEIRGTMLPNHKCQGKAHHPAALPLIDLLCNRTEALHPGQSV